MGDIPATGALIECSHCLARYRVLPTDKKLPPVVSCVRCGNDFVVYDETKSSSDAPKAQILRKKSSNILDYAEISSSEALEGDSSSAFGTSEFGVESTVASGHDFNRDEATRLATVPKKNADEPTLKDGDLDINSDAFQEALRMSKMEQMPNFDFPSDSFVEESENINDKTMEPPPAVQKEVEKARIATKEQFPGVETTKELAVLKPPAVPLPKPNKPSGKKVPIGDLLKKVREKRKVEAPTELSTPLIQIGEKRPPLPSNHNPLGDESSFGTTTSPNKAVRKRTDDSLLIKLRKFDADKNREPIGMGGASEARGSGYIRLPTTDILDVLGEGNYRLRVEDIVYEPVDEKGLVSLIKGGVLLGAEEIAEADGDWMPIGQHPVFSQLRKRMAEEAHELLRKVSSGSNEFGKTEEIAAIPEKTIETRSDDVTQPMQPIPNEATKPFEPPSQTLRMFADDVHAPSPTSVVEVLEQQLESPAERLADTVESEPFVLDSEDMTSIPPIPVDASAQFTQSEVEELEQPSTHLPEPSVDLDEDSEPYLLEAPHIDPTLDVRRSDLPHPDDLATPKKKSRFPLALIVFLGLLMFVGTAVGLVFTGAIDSVLQMDFFSSDGDPKKPSTEGPEAAIAEAMTLATAAIPTADSTDAWIAAADTVEEPAIAIKLLHDQFKAEPTAKVAQELVERLKATGDEKRAFAIAAEGAKLEGGDALQEMVAALQKAQLGDTGKVTIDASFGTAKGTSSGKRAGWLIETAGGSMFAFVPNRQSGDEVRAVAAHKLCVLLQCPFGINSVRSASVSTDVASKWIESLSGDQASAAAKILRSAESNDDQITGTLFAISETAFPVSETSFWRSWMDGADDELGKSFADVATDGPADYRDALNREAGSETTRKIAGQLSSIFLYDFLINNWDRFESRPARVAIEDGKLVSQHVGVAFEPRASTRVKGRFNWISTFDKSFVDNIRALDEKETLNALFPDATSVDRARFSVFWKQRNNALERIDSLAQSKGDAVYAVGK